MSERWVRSQRAAVADQCDGLLLVDPDGTVRRLDGDSGDLARAVLAFLAQPRSEDDVIAHVESLAGPLGERRAVVGELLRLLEGSRAITRATRSVAGSPGVNVVLGISGAIAATHAPALLSALQRRGHTVEVALTRTAQRFVSIDALGAIAGREIHTTIWPACPHAPAPHIALAAWADLVVVYPASGTTLGRIAHGDFSDLVAAIALATRAPVVVAPSMNLAMLEAAAVQRNLAQLRDDGIIVLHGVPSQEVADAPATRTTITGAAASPAEVVATIEALRAAGALARREAATTASTSSWDAVYRAAAGGDARNDGLPLVPWASDRCDDDIAAQLDESGQGKRLLDVGSGMGQIARHAAQLRYHVTATDISEVGLRLAREHSDRALDITWVRDDICASTLVSEYDVIIDRATLHTLPRARLHAWAAGVQRLLAPGGRLIVKAHREGVPAVTNGWSAEDLAARLPQLQLVAAHAAELPGLLGPAPVPSILAVFQRV